MTIVKPKLCLTVFIGVSFALACAEKAPAAEKQPQYAAVLSVKNMCCAKESVPAIKELSKLKGVGRVSVDYKTRSLMIEPTTVALSPRAVWEAAERVKIEPTRMATPEGVYTSKPRR